MSVQEGHGASLAAARPYGPRDRPTLVSMDEGDWTLAEGVRDVLRFVGRRALPALLVWGLLAAGILLWARAGTADGDASWFGILIAFLSVHAGIAVGMVLAKGLVDAVRFGGWIPAWIAGGAAIVVIAVGTLALVPLLPDVFPFYRWLLGTTAAIGAAGAVVRLTWGET
jgi:hypothetical protein